MNYCRVCRGKRLNILYYLKAKFGIYHCKKCNTDNLWPTPTEAEVNEQYMGNYSEAYEQEEIRRFKVIDFENILDKIDKTMIKSVLEVGCANAFITEHVISKGLRGTGIDIDKKMMKIAQKKLGNERVILDNFDSHLFPDKFDLVVMIDFLEHVYDPVITLKKTYRTLNKGGYVFVVTPNIDAFRRKLFGKFWTAYYLEHFTCFSKNSIDFLSKRSKLKIVHFEKFHKTISLEYFVRKLSFKFGFLSFLNKIVKYIGFNPLFKIDDNSMLIILKK